MSRRKKKSWGNGNLFIIPLKNEQFAVGQVLDLQMTNVVRIALFDKVVSDISFEFDKNSLENTISLVACTREQLDYGVWKIVGNQVINIPLSEFPNEQFRNNGW